MKEPLRTAVDGLRAAFLVISMGLAVFAIVETHPHRVAGLHPHFVANYSLAGVEAGLAVVAALLAIAIRPQPAPVVNVHIHQWPPVESKAATADQK